MKFKLGYMHTNVYNLHMFIIKNMSENLFFELRKLMKKMIFGFPNRVKFKLGYIHTNVYNLHMFIVINMFENLIIDLRKLIKDMIFGFLTGLNSN